MKQPTKTCSNIDRQTSSCAKVGLLLCPSHSLPTVRQMLEKNVARRTKSSCTVASSHVWALTLEETLGCRSCAAFTALLRIAPKTYPIVLSLFSLTKQKLPGGCSCGMQWVQMRAILIVAVNGIVNDIVTGHKTFPSRDMTSVGPYNSRPQPFHSQHKCRKRNKNK